ncbi:MAG: leucine--tRNA ligase [Nanoarchaeota archaeon]
MDFKKIESKWQEKWDEDKVFEVSEDNAKEKYYILEMFPYPSGSGLHMGHAFNYTIGDIHARNKLLRGFNVLHPMGYDALGLPAENAAVKEGEHPKEYTDKSTKNYIQQQKHLGLSYDWSRVVSTADPKYYKWDQWIFLKMFEKGLAYQKTSAVNWCPKCNTVLANEQVEGGKCWRHEDTDVEVKHLKQWFLKTTAYVEELYDNIDKLEDWPERTKAMQKNWIGKSHGTEIEFDIDGEKWPVFTTRPDTIFGVTFMVVSAQHSRLRDITSDDQKDDVEAFLKKLHGVSEKELEDTEKEGVFIGTYATNPATGDKVPIYAGNFVVADYGSGMVMAVPAHDQRDFEFAKKYGIEIKQVIDGELTGARAYTDTGKLMNSGEFDGLDNDEAKEKITEWLAKRGVARQTVNFKLRDWGISRQRYWGTPIPIIHCDSCGAVPVPEKDLPVKLPFDVKFGKGNPLETNEDFINTTCPKCDAPAKRETDTMDTFVNSSWYYLRYTDPHNDDAIFDRQKADYWAPINQYIGGAEHACMHLIYFRFYTKFLRDIGLLDFDEPTQRLFHQGMLHGEDGNKMSKSKGNVKTPESVSEKYGIDTARFFVVSVASPDKDINWSEAGIEGSFKFLKRVDTYMQNVKLGSSSDKVKSKVQRAIRDVSDDIDKFRYNLATIKIRELFSSFEDEIAKEDLESFLILLNPFCPHITEEWWENLGNEPYISTATWPESNPDLIDDTAEYVEKFHANVKADLYNLKSIANITDPEKIKLIISPEWKYEFFDVFKGLIETTRNPKEIIPEIMKTELRTHGKQITKLIPACLKDPSKIPKVLLGQEKEHEALDELSEELKKEFGADVVIERAEDSSEGKAQQASPGKPAIILE